MAQQRNGKSDALRTITANLAPQPFLQFPLGFASSVAPFQSYILLIHTLCTSTSQAISMSAWIAFCKCQQRADTHWVQKIKKMDWFGPYMKRNLNHRGLCSVWGFLALVILLPILLFYFPLSSIILTSFRRRGSGKKSIPWARTESQALPNGSCPTSLGGKECHYMPPYREWENQSSR